MFVLRVIEQSVLMVNPGDEEQIPLLPTKSSCDNSLHLFVKNSLLPPSLPLLLNLIQKEERGQHKCKTDEPYLRKDRQDTE